MMPEVNKLSVTK